jgi:heme-degrading monooxygenase HmoA
VIARHWKGIARSEEAENYIRHLQEETFPKLSEIDGFVYASILKRETEQGTEFLIVTHWQTMDAIREFAGETTHIAVVPPVVQEMMVEYDQEVAHYEIVEEYVPL